MRIAALYVDPRGVYAGMPDIDLWDEKRDARRYHGPLPVVAHPPCSRWCRLAGLVEARWGHKRGDDGGCFESALGAVRHWGGYWSIRRTATHGQRSGFRSRIGKAVGIAASAVVGRRTSSRDVTDIRPRKRRGSYVHGATLLPPMRWGYDPDARSKALVSWCRNHVPSVDTRARVGKKAAAATPHEFRDLLLSIARSVRR